MWNAIKSLKITLPAEEDLEEKLRNTSIFLAKLLALGLVFRTVLMFRPDTYFLQSQLASLTSHILSIFNVDLPVEGALLVGENSSYLVTQDCLGWKSMFAFTGLIVASAKDILNEVKFLLAGLAIILVANIIRVTTTVYLSHNGIVSFDIIHTIFWKWGLTAIILLIWVSWLYGASSKIKRTFKYQSSKS